MSQIVETADSAITSLIPAMSCAALNAFGFIIISKDGKGLKLHGRSLLLIRNVGHLMTNPSIVLKDGSEIPERIMDAFFTTAAGFKTLRSSQKTFC